MTAEVQVGIVYNGDQLQKLAPSAVAVADAAIAVKMLKEKVKHDRERGSVEARDYLRSRDGYKASKRKFRERLATYAQIKKEI